MNNEMVMEYNYFLMGLNLLEIGKIIKLMVLVDLNLLMELTTRAISKIIKFKKVFCITLVVHILKDILMEKEIYLEMEKLNLQTVKYFKENGIVMEF